MSASKPGAKLHASVGMVSNPINLYDYGMFHEPIKINACTLEVRTTNSLTCESFLITLYTPYWEINKSDKGYLIIYDIPVCFEKEEWTIAWACRTVSPRSAQRTRRKPLKNLCELRVLCGEQRLSPFF